MAGVNGSSETPIDPAAPRTCTVPWLLLVPNHGYWVQVGDLVGYKYTENLQALTARPCWSRILRSFGGPAASARAL